MVDNNNPSDPRLYYYFVGMMSCSLRSVSVEELSIIVILVLICLIVMYIHLLLCDCLHSYNFMFLIVEPTTTILTVMCSTKKETRMKQIAKKKWETALVTCIAKQRKSLQKFVGTSATGVGWGYGVAVERRNHG